MRVGGSWSPCCYFRHGGGSEPGFRPLGVFRPIGSTGNIPTRYTHAIPNMSITKWSENRSRFEPTIPKSEFPDSSQNRTLVISVICWTVVFLPFAVFVVVYFEIRFGVQNVCYFHPFGYFDLTDAPCNHCHLPNADTVITKPRIRLGQVATSVGNNQAPNSHLPTPRRIREALAPHAPETARERPLADQIRVTGFPDRTGAGSNTRALNAAVWGYWLIESIFFGRFGSDEAIARALQEQYTFLISK